ncbi:MULTISPECIES: helix-turn-helix domain-containing protein [unclassified Nocardioides]|uniref:helix-turn-helix domain-containing protein n=1 Tax=Nocardioides sp. (strain ATCC BAA-499 / JS614) TaxID=196162 RepID=UPI000A30FB12
MNEALDQQLLLRVRTQREAPPVEELRRVRELAGVSRAELAVALQVHRSTVSRWERGLSVPRPQRLARYVTTVESLRSEVGA